MKKTIFLLLIIAVTYFFVGFILCQNRANSKDPIYLRSDFLVFVLPFILAMILNSYVFWTSGMFKERLGLRLSLVIFGSTVASFMVFILYLAIAINIYGS
jgi:hypothetical protein